MSTTWRTGSLPFPRLGVWMGWLVNWNAFVVVGGFVFLFCFLGMAFWWGWLWLGSALGWGFEPRPQVVAVRLGFKGDLFPRRGWQAKVLKRVFHVRGLWFVIHWKKMIEYSMLLPFLPRKQETPCLCSNWLFVWLRVKPPVPHLTPNTPSFAYCCRLVGFIAKQVPAVGFDATISIKLSPTSPTPASPRLLQNTSCIVPWFPAAEYGPKST